MREIMDQARYFLYRESLGKKIQFSNHYLTTDSVCDLFQKNRLFAFEIPNGIIVQIDRGTHYSIQMVLSNINSLNGIKIPLKDKPNVFDIVYRSNRKLNESDVIEQQLIRFGFYKYRDSMEYAIGTLSDKESYDVLLEKLQLKGFYFRPMSIDHREKAYRILYDTFGSYEIPDNDSFQWERIISEGWAFEASTTNGTIVAVNLLPAAFSGGLTAVHSKYLGLGIGKAIQYYGYHLSGKLRPHDRIWVAAENNAIRHLTVMMGGFDTGRRAKQYVMDFVKDKQ